MPRRSDAELEADLARLEKIILTSPGGLPRPEIQRSYEDQYGEELATRSAIRWLNRLGDEGRIRIEGAKRNRRYLPPENATVKPPIRKGSLAGTRVASEITDGVVSLSEEGAELQRLIQRPRAMREPVGYNRDFLGAYDPTSPESWYLSEDVRGRLNEMGQTPDPRRPAGTYARDILEQLLIDLSWSSSRLEGNTYSRADTEELLKRGKRAEGKDPAEAQMIENHQTAIRHIVDNVEQARFDRRTTRTLHAILSGNLLGDPQKEGAFRTGPVKISGSTYIPYANPHVIEECFDEILAKAQAIHDPFEQAFFVMVHIPYLQPFWDVNKRTSRIAANISLFRENLVPLSFVDVPRAPYLEAILVVYEMNRVEMLRDVFEWAYRRSCDQYRVIRESAGDLPPAPDPTRLRYGTAIEQAVGAIVRMGVLPDAETLRGYAQAHDIAPDDVELFVERTGEILQNLNEGSAGRYGIGPEAFERWKEQIRGADKGSTA